MRKAVILLALLVAQFLFVAGTASGTATKNGMSGATRVSEATTTTAVADVPFSSAQQVYVFHYGYAVCNGSIAVVSYAGNEITVNASKLLYLPKHNAIIYSNSSGIFRIDPPSLASERIFSGAVSGFWVSVGQDVIYVWSNATIFVTDLSGLIKASTTYPWPVVAVVPYGWDYWLFVATSNGTAWQDYIYSDGRRLTLSYTRSRPVPSEAFFIDWGGDRTLIYANKTHLVFWRTNYDTETVYELPTALSDVRLFQAMSYWSYSVAIADDDTVIVYTRSNFYTYSFTGGISYAKMYVGMRTWGSDWPWIVVASDDGLRLIYIDPDTGDWTSQTVFYDPINSDVYIDDLDSDGSEEFYFVSGDGRLVGVEIAQVMYPYAYRAVIPSLYFWAGPFLIYDRSAGDWDGDELSNGREVNELQTSPLRADTDLDGLTDYDEVYVTGTNPVMNDTDGDGLGDWGEINAYHTNPAKADTDGDGLPDGEEVARGTDPLSNDTDMDGLMDGREMTLGTDPLRADTDGDGLPDGEEVARGTDPLRADTDGDGLNDYEEQHTFHTNPSDPDTDNDGLTDYDEIKVYHTDPLRADTDGDGVEDGVEVRLGFDPKDPGNNPKSLWHVVTTFWWAFVFVFLFGAGVGMLAVVSTVTYLARRKKIPVA